MDLFHSARHPAAARGIIKVFAPLLHIARRMRKGLRNTWSKSLYGEARCFVAVFSFTNSSKLVHVGTGAHRQAFSLGTGFDIADAPE
jgi:hypothetical protein